MTNFYRLIKPDWSRPKLPDDAVNPDFKKSIVGPNILEGCFSEQFIKSKNKEGYNVYWFPNKPSKNVYKEDVKFLSGRHIEEFQWCFVDMDLKDGVWKSKEEFIEFVKTSIFPPSFAVNSGNGVHVYWKFSNLCRKSYLTFQRALLKYF